MNIEFATEPLPIGVHELGYWAILRLAATTNQQRKHKAERTLQQGEDKISVFSGQRCDFFQFTEDGDSYVGENIRIKATMKFIGDELTLVLKGTNGYTAPSKKLRLKSNEDIGLSETTMIQLATPDNIDYSRNTALHELPI